MGKIVRMSLEEARQYVEANNDEIQKRYDEAPVIDDGFSKVTSKPIARGLGEFCEYIDKQKADKKKNTKNKRATKKAQEQSISYQNTSHLVVPMSASGL